MASRGVRETPVRMTLHWNPRVLGAPGRVMGHALFGRGRGPSHRPQRCAGRAGLASAGKPATAIGSRCDDGEEDWQTGLLP